MANFTLMQFLSPSCAVLTNGDFTWQIDQLISLYVCFWPVIITLLAACWVLPTAFKARRKVVELHAAEDRRAAAAELLRAPRRGPS